MGFDLYFVCPVTKEYSECFECSYSNNIFFQTFDITIYGGKTGQELITLLENGITAMTAKYKDRKISKDLLRPLPGNYVHLLQELLATAKRHPTWIFVCE